MADKFEGYFDKQSDPAENAAIVTPNDSTDLPNATRALICDAAGTLTVDMVEVGTNIAIPVQAGITPIRVSRVYATGTTVTNIVGLW